MSGDINKTMIWRPESQQVLNEWKNRGWDFPGEVTGTYLDSAGDKWAWFRYYVPVEQIVPLDELHDVDEAVIARH